jgi:soluble lytic murein transglycosylase-like protein
MLSVEFSLPKNSLVSMIMKESSWDHTAISPKGARGLMQLTPIAVKDIQRNSGKLPKRCGKIVGEKVYTDPGMNVLAGACYFKMLLQNYKGNLRLALAAYNGGSTRIKRVPWPKETRDYVRKITLFMKEDHIGCKKP